MMIFKFIDAYFKAALWSTMDDNEEPLDQKYGENDFNAETFLTMVRDCMNFYKQFKDVWTEANVERGGHDFWLTRNGHGAGFWDGDWPEELGKQLTEASQKFGEFIILVDDDGLLNG